MGWLEGRRRPAHLLTGTLEEQYERAARFHREAKQSMDEVQAIIALDPTVEGFYRESLERSRMSAVYWAEVADELEEKLHGE